MYLIYEDHFITLHKKEGTKIGRFIIHMYLNIKQIPLYFTFCWRYSSFNFFYRNWQWFLGDSWIEGSLETSVEGKKVVGIINNLHPATIYSIQIIAENSLGMGEPSIDMRLTTEEEAPAAAARNIKVEATSSETLVVTWDPPPSDQWNGVLLGHNVGYREAGWVVV